MPEAASADRAILQISATSIVGAVREALPWLAEYPYGCTEHTMSRFLPAVAARDAMRRLSIEDPDLERKLPLLSGGEARPVHVPQRLSRRRFGQLILRDDRAAAPARFLPDRQSFGYSLRPLLPGLYHSMPATAGSMYDPTRTGRSAAFVLRVVER